MADLGRFIWFDLMTTDVEGAQAFYKDCVGWNTVPFENDEKPYTMFAIGEEPIGGSVALPEEAKAMGIPPHWIAFAKVVDVDATCALATELGGVVHHPPMDIATIGRVAFLADPQGAGFAVFSPLDDKPMYSGPARVGDMSWHELNTTDYESAWKFYAKLLGWIESDTLDMGPELGTYFMFKRPGLENSVGGMFNVLDLHGAPPHWLHYIRVADMDGTLAKITAGGGQVLHGPMEVPGGDHIAQCLDPQGGAFAIVASLSK